MDTLGILYLFDDDKMTISCNNRYKSYVGTKYLRCNRNGRNILESLINETSNGTRTNASNNAAVTSVMRIIAYLCMFLLLPFIIVIIAYYYCKKYSCNRTSILESMKLNTYFKNKNESGKENDENKSVIMNLWNQINK